MTEDHESVASAFSTRLAQVAHLIPSMGNTRWAHPVATAVVLTGSGHSATTAAMRSCSRAAARERQGLARRQAEIHGGGKWCAAQWSVFVAGLIATIAVAVIVGRKAKAKLKEAGAGDGAPKR